MRLGCPRVGLKMGNVKQASSGSCPGVTHTEDGSPCPDVGYGSHTERAQAGVRLEIIRKIGETDGLSVATISSGDGSTCRMGQRTKVSSAKELLDRLIKNQVTVREFFSEWRINFPMNSCYCFQNC